MKTATYIKDLDDRFDYGMLFKVKPPVSYRTDVLNPDVEYGCGDGMGVAKTQFIVVSKISQPRQTSVFATDGKGVVLDWHEIAEYDGSWDFDEVLKKEGYTIKGIDI